MTFDRDTGELFEPAPNGKLSDRAAEAGVRAKVELRRQEVGYGQTRIHHALERVARELPVHIQNSKSGARGKYAPGKDIGSITKPIFDRHGIRCVWRTGHVFRLDKDVFIPVACHLIHAESGEIEITELAVPVPRLDPQGIGSAVTYGKRYTLLMACGLWTDDAADDDGEGAMPRNITKKVEESALMLALKKEIDGLKTLTDLVDWANEENKKVRDRLNRLNDAETERLRMYYDEHRKKLMGSAE